MRVRQNSLSEAKPDWVTQGRSLHPLRRYFRSQQLVFPSPGHRSVHRLPLKYNRREE